MSWVVLLLAAAVLFVLEKLWAPAALKALRFKGSCDRLLAEPGEPVLWSAVIENQSRLPIPFVRLREHFPPAAHAKAEQKWIDTHCQRSIRQWSVEEKLSLKPLQRCTRTVSLVFSRRGAYQLGNYRLSVGDLLGFRERGKEGDSQKLVVIPERARNQKALIALGGFLGDISVRRFILEDPILTVGFRDYTGREPLKAVSWTRTAMTGTMQVKQYDHTAEQTVMILLDLEGGTPSETEACFRLMRSVCEQLEQKKIPFGLRTNGNLPGPVGKVFHIAEGLGASHLNTILYALGQADATCFYSLRYLVKQTLDHRKNNESYIVITPSLTEENHALLRTLETAVGNPLCILTGASEVDAA